MNVTPRILVPLDGSEASTQILQHVEPLARALGARIVLLQAVAGPTELMTGTHIALDVARQAVEDDLREARRRLLDIAGGLEQRGVAADVIVVEAPPARAILGHLQDITMIALTTHGRSGLARSLMGSVADEVVRRSHLPVLLVRPREA